MYVSTCVCGQECARRLQLPTPTAGRQSPLKLEVGWRGSAAQQRPYPLWSVRAMNVSERANADAHVRMRLCGSASAYSCIWHVGALAVSESACLCAPACVRMRVGVSVRRRLRVLRVRRSIALGGRACCVSRLPILVAFFLLLLFFCLRAFVSNVCRWPRAVAS